MKLNKLEDLIMRLPIGVFIFVIPVSIVLWSLLVIGLQAGMMPW